MPTTGKLRIRYVSLRSDCSACPLRPHCLGPASDRRTIERWEHEATLERHRTRMRTQEAEKIMRKRKALAEIAAALIFSLLRTLLVSLAARGHRTTPSPAFATLT